MTTHLATLYTVTETRVGDTDEWFVMTAPITVISAFFMMHPEAGARIIRECAENNGAGVCTLVMPRGRIIENGGLFLVRLHSVGPYDAHARKPA